MGRVLIKKWNWLTRSKLYLNHFVLTDIYYETNLIVTGSKMDCQENCQGTVLKENT